MFRKILITIIVNAFLVIGLVVSFNEAVFSLLNVVNASFVVGILTFYIGLILTTNAASLFRATGYALKGMFTWRLKKSHRDYYKHLQEHDKKHDKTTGVPLLIVGGLVTTINVILSYAVLMN
jgi:hypothetical protein